MKTLNFVKYLFLLIIIVLVIIEEVFDSGKEVHLLLLGFVSLMIPIGILEITKLLTNKQSYSDLTFRELIFKREDDI